MLDIAAIDAKDRVIVALDCDRERALELADALKGVVGWMKVGMTLYYACGPEIVSEMHERGFKVFLDLKLHDIPHQVRGAAETASLAGADLLTIHGLGGSAMAAAAREGVEAAASKRSDRTNILAVTVLTSMDQEALAEIGVDSQIEDEVERLAGNSGGAGADGIVCSPLEAAKMRSLLGPEALIVCPGVRPAGAEVGDQKRVATPSGAIRDGASHIVVGRPITSADDPAAAGRSIVCELQDLSR